MVRNESITIRVKIDTAILVLVKADFGKDLLDFGCCKVLTELLE